MKRLLRLLALTLLLALAVGIVPAMAETVKPSIVPQKLYAGVGKFWLGDFIKNWGDMDDLISVKSSNPAVLRVDKDNIKAIIPRKPGKAKVTVSYLSGDTMQKMSAWFTVVKYPKAVQRLSINGKVIKLVYNEKIRDFYWPDERDDETASVRIHLTPAKGWKITGIKAYTYNAYKNTNKHIALTVRNNVKFKVKGDHEAVVTYTLKKGKEKFNYTVVVARGGE